MPRFIKIIVINIIVMTKYWFKIKGVMLTVFIILISNAYLIYLLSTYIVDKTTGAVLVFITNEIFIFIGILFYMYYSLKVEVKLKLQEQYVLIDKRKK